MLCRVSGAHCRLCELMEVLLVQVSIFFLLEHHMTHLETVVDHDKDAQNSFIGKSTSS